MKTALASFGSGLLFAIGLAVAGMTRPGKILGFLDVAGDWDPSLLFVMGGAIAAHVCFARRSLRPGARPLFADSYEARSRAGVDGPLVLGAALFGVGWGLAGYCPGPAIVSLPALSTGTLAFVAAMGIGSLAVDATFRASSPDRPVLTPGASDRGPFPRA